MNKAKFAVLMVVCCSCISVYAQQDSVLKAPLTVVSVIKDFDASVSTKVAQNDTNIKKNFVQNTLADALIQNNVIHVKSYGTGLQSVSFRGTGAEHTAVYWQGMPVNSATNGTTDFSLLPSFLMENVFINFGDGGAAIGSSAVGGSVKIGDDASFKKRRIVLGEINSGSYSNFSGGLGYQWSNGKWTNKTKVFAQKAENNFLYNDKFSVGQPEKRMENNVLEQQGFLQQLGYKRKRNQLHFSTLYLNANRGLANVASNNQKETQKDKSVRSVLNYKRYGAKRWTYNADAGYSMEYLHYLNPGIEDSEYKIHSYKFGAQVKKQIGKDYLLGFTKFLSQNGKAANYVSNPSQNSSDLGLTYAKLFYKFKSRTTVRATLFEGEILPLNLGQILQYNYNKHLQISASVNSIYRIPTFNDRYWVGSGSPDLKSEKGWKQDLNVRHGNKKAGYEITGYHILVDDWLIWLPDAGVWRPQNIRKVRSMGLELSGYKTFEVRKVKGVFKINYSNTDSKNIKVEGNNEDAQGKQLIYVPYHKIGGILSFNYRNWKIVSTLNYTGEIFTSSDNSSTLDAFTVFSTSLSKGFKYKKTRGNIALSARNLFDKRYEVIKNRPVMGRTIWLKMTFSIQNRIKQNNKPGIILIEKLKT